MINRSANIAGAEYYYYRKVKFRKILQFGNYIFVRFRRLTMLADAILILCISIFTALLAEGIVK